MASEHRKTGNHAQLLHAATGRLQKEEKPSAAHKREKTVETKKQEASSGSSETGEEQREKDEAQEKSPSPAFPNALKKDGVGKERLAELRRHLQAQFSIQDHQEDLSPGSQLMELVGNIVHHGKAEGGETGNGILEGQCPACGVCRCHASCSQRLSAEVTEALQREMAVLKGEVTASIDSMKKEIVGVLSSLHENLQAYGDHQFLQAPDLSPLEELEESTPGQMKGSHRKLSRNETPGIRPEEKFKSQSVPTLHPLPLSSRNQAMLRVMSTRTAQNSFWARSNSDPVEPLPAKSTPFPPPIPKVLAKKSPPKTVPHPASKSYFSNGKYGGKTTPRGAKPHPQGDLADPLRLLHSAQMVHGEE